MKNEVIEPATESATETALSNQDLLQQWQGHRRLTRRTIEAFPEKDLFTFSVAGMRPFGSWPKKCSAWQNRDLKG